MSLKNISILGINIELTEINKYTLKGLNIDIYIKYSFYKARFNNQDLCIVVSNDSNVHTPRKYREILSWFEEVVGMPVAIYLKQMSYYERARMIEQGVYFIVSDEYAFLPSLIINSKIKKQSKIIRHFTPASQYLFIWLMQNSNIKSFTINDLTAITPYNYLALSRAVSELEERHILESTKDNNKTKHISIVKERKQDIWKKIVPYLTSPIKEIIYADKIPDIKYLISSTDALFHYNNKTPQKSSCIAIWERDKKVVTEWNGIEGDYTIEIWKYPPFLPETDEKYVDRLSLFLSFGNRLGSQQHKDIEDLIDDSLLE